MANELHKAGYNLSRAFKKAWRTAKGTAIKAAGVTYEGRQEVLKYLSQFRPENLTVTLERDTYNTYDRNTIRIVVLALLLVTPKLWLGKVIELRATL